MNVVSLYRIIAVTAALTAGYGCGLCGAPENPFAPPVFKDGRGIVNDGNHNVINGDDRLPAHLTHGLDSLYTRFRANLNTSNLLNNSAGIDPPASNDGLMPTALLTYDDRRLLDLDEPTQHVVLPFVFDRNQVDMPVASAVYLTSWSGGGLFASGSRISYPGLMGIESGSVGLAQRLGKVDVSLGLSATKYGSFNSLITSYGIDASLGWTINETFSLHAFGSYVPASSLRGAINANPFVNPMMSGMTGTANYGGYLGVNMSSRFGVDVGAQRYYNMATGQWTTQPIVRPYVRLNNGSALGVDIGGILYNLFVGDRNETDWSDRRFNAPSTGAPGSGTVAPDKSTFRFRKH